MEGTSDDEVKWDLQSSGDEGGASAEAPAVVLPKPKKPRSKAQLAAFEKARGSGEGSVLVYVGEDEGGETADGDFFAAVRANWTELESWELDGTPGTHVRVYKQQMHR